MRLVVWNIHSAVGLDGVASLERIAGVIRELEPDLVALNEVRTTPLANQTRILAGSLRMAGAFHRVLVRPGLRYGNAILTSGRIVACRGIRLPSVREPRGLLLARLDVDGQSFVFGVTHLGLGAEERAAQRSAIARELPYGEPVVLVGDFNTTSRALFPLTDALRLVETPPTFPAASPAAAIDRVLLSDHWLVADAGTRGSEASDHLPLFVDIERVA